MSILFRFLYYGIFIRLVVLFFLGLNVRQRQRLPMQGPAILVSNHNSHLDTMVLMTLITRHGIPLPKPVAAADYFLRNPLMRWFSTKVVGILPIKRKKDHAKEDLLQPVYEALEQSEILIFFPEGSRGEPEKLAELKGGIAKLAEKYPQVPIVPIWMYGLGKSLPRGEALLVPFFCDVFVGESLFWQGERNVLIEQIRHSLSTLEQQAGRLHDEDLW